MDDPIPDFNQKIPTYFPVHLTLRISTDFTHTQLLREIDDKITFLKNVTTDFLENVMFTCKDTEVVKQFLQNQTNAYTKFVQTKFQLHDFQNSLRQAQLSLSSTRRLEDDISLENYDHYCELEKENFADAIIQEIDAKHEESYKNILKADLWYQYVRNAYFVLQHPEDPLPDDQADEELAMEGGKISLKDPLSLNYFVDPVMSMSCKHVFEKEHIMRLLSMETNLKCPITGCVEMITKKELLPDLLMRLRVKAHKEKEKTREKSRATRVQ